MGTKPITKPESSPAGFEPATSGFGGRKPTIQSPETTSTYDAPHERVTPTGTTSDENGTPNPGLATIIAAWPTLPELTRRNILAIVAAGEPTKSGGTGYAIHCNSNSIRT